jgi:ribosomal protein S18 acetylase RimI-like enzyme
MNEKPVLPVKIRAVNQQDVPFIFNSWLKSFRETGYLCNPVSNTIYFENHHKLIQKILQRATVYVACDEKYPDQIFGYIVAEKIEGVFVLHYVYIKHNFRKSGIAKSLLNSFDHDTVHASCCTHLTKAAEKLTPKYNMIYHPYIILVDYEPTLISGEGSSDENS